MSRQIKNKKSNQAAHMKLGKYQSLFTRGHKITVPNHPTEICTQPWFPLTVRVAAFGGTVFTKGDLYTAFVQQLGGLSFVNSSLNVRIHDIRVWGDITIPIGPLTVTFYDLFDEVITNSGATTSDQMILEQITNYPDAVNRPRVGYTYSSAQQQKSLTIVAGNPDRVLTFSNEQPNSTRLLYIRLLWRPYVFVPIGYQARYDPPPLYPNLPNYPNIKHM